MAGRILGMGDVLTLIEKAQQTFDQKQVEELQRKLRQNQFDLNDFLMQMRQMQQMGPLDQLLKMIPGLGAQFKDVQIEPKELKRVEAIILSMTAEERANPHIINASRKRRIARGSGTTVHEVNELLSQFEEMRHMIRELNAPTVRRRQRQTQDTPAFLRIKHTERREVVWRSGSDSSAWGRRSARSIVSWLHPVRHRGMDGSLKPSVTTIR
jgi:signal recognition particle GTPase